jgi:hypothetical protein
VRAPLLCLLALIACAVLAASRQASAAPFDPRSEDWEGLSQLVRMAQADLGPRRVAVVSTLDVGKLKREDGLLLVHPERTVDSAELSAFMRAGGRLVLLDDYGTGDGLLARFGIRRVPLPERPAEMLRGNPSFAVAEPAGAHPAVRDVSRVVTNHATGLEHPALSPVLVVHGDGEPDVLLAVAGAVGQGRLLAVGDASVAINSMLRYPGNRTLCAALVRYLMEDDAWGAREGKLYILANDFETIGSFGGDDSRLAGAAGGARRALEEALETLRHDGMPPLAAYLLALAIGLAVVVWTSVRAGRTHKVIAPRFVRRVPAVAQGGVAGHAAVLQAPRTSRLLALLEFKSALEEDLATRLGLDRPPPHDELLARLRAAQLLDADGAASLGQLLKTLTEMEGLLVTERRNARRRVRDVDVLEVASRVKELEEQLGPIGAPPAP